MSSAKLPAEVEERYRHVRGGLIRNGTSLNAWCRARGLRHQNARAALLGLWTGPKAEKLVAEVMQAAGVGQ